MRLDGNAAGILRQGLRRVESDRGHRHLRGLRQGRGGRGGRRLRPRTGHCFAVRTASVLAKLVTDGDRVWVDLRGVRTLELRV